MEQLINKYLNDHKNAWQESSQRSERARLNGVSSILSQSEDPQFVYDSVKDQLAPYAIQTLFTRLNHFYTWLLEEGLRTGPNIFSRWRRKNARLFKGVYRREKLNVSFEDAEKRIANIDTQDIRDAALTLLRTGMRLCELENVSGGKVIGKGEKERKIYSPARKTTATRGQIYRALKKIGLKPHTLRKLFATRVARAGARPEDLCEIMGWSSIKTAYYYLQPKKEEELKALVLGAL